MKTEYVLIDRKNKIARYFDSYVPLYNQVMCDYKDVGSLEIMEIEKDDEKKTHFESLDFETIANMMLFRCIQTHAEAMLGMDCMSDYRILILASNVYEHMEKKKMLQWSDEDIQEAFCDVLIDMLSVKGSM